MGRTGSRPLLTLPIIKKIEELLTEGHYATTVIDALGISEVAWYTWIDKGKEYEEAETDEERENIPNGLLYSQFYLAVKRAQSKAEMEALSVIRKASKKQWQAAAWYLERKHRQKWGRVYQEPTGNTNSLDAFLAGLKAECNKDDEVESGEE